jgi:hypothetical protein
MSIQDIIDTHDITLMVNDTVACGLTVAPQTYAVNFAPTFVPRFAMMGDRRGIDRARWNSFIQTRFDGGAGQMYWSSANANNKFADSNYVDIGQAMQLKGSQLGLVGNVPINVQVYENMDDAVAGDISVAMAPRGTTSLLGNDMHVLWTAKHAVHVVEMSGRPHVWQHVGGVVYTSLTYPTLWDKTLEHVISDRLTGKWVTFHTFQTGPVITRAVKFSSVVVLAMQNIDNPKGFIKIYGSKHTAGLTASTHYTPAYSTNISDVVVYDNKLWKAYQGTVRYLQPTAGTVPATWSDDLGAGDPTTNVTHMIEFNGRLYVGKEDGLWVFDANRTYKVVGFEDDSSFNNFAMMVVHRGYLYFNIRHLVYRLSTVGTVELMQAPIEAGFVVDGASYGDNLYVITYMPPSFTQVFVLNGESGGWRRWFWSEEVGYGAFKSPRTIKNASGLLLISPMLMSETYSTASMQSPIVMADYRTSPFLANNPNFSRTHSWIVTSMLDFGLPHLDKLLNALVVDYNLLSKDDRIDVSYIDKITELFPPTVVYFGRRITGSGPGFHFDATPYVDAVSGGGMLGDQLLNTLDHTISTQSNTIMMGFREIPAGIRFVEDKGGTGFCAHEESLWHLRFYAGSISGVIELPQNSDTVWGEDFALHEYPGRNPNTKWYIKTWSTPSSWWGRRTAQAMCVNYLGDDAPEGAPTDYLYWVIFDIGDPGDYNTLEWTRFDMIQGIRTSVTLKDQPWNYLGSIDGADAVDLYNTSKRISFPESFNTKQIMLRYDLWSSRLTRPSVTKYEIEYMPFPSNLEVIRASVMATDGIELRSRPAPTYPLENSAAFVAASLFSCAASGLVYSVSVPWPTRHVIKAIVSISSPGATIPFVPDSGVPDGIIPVEFAEA